jgi:endo-1,4-beta-D-glucanase Y
MAYHRCLFGLVLALTACTSTNSGSPLALGGSTAIGSGGSSTTSMAGRSSSSGGTATSNGGTTASSAGSSGGSVPQATAAFPLPLNVKSQYCVYPTNYDNERVRAAYKAWYDATVTADGAGGYLRVKKPDSGSVIGSTVSEGIGYGMLLSVYVNDQHLFDNLWKYEQSHLGQNGLMDWEIGPNNQITSGGKGAATDGDEDMAWALIMADRQWGGSGSLGDTYLNHANQLIELILQYEVDVSRNYLLRPGDQWGNVDVTNISYFAPAYYRVFGQVTGKVEEWNRVIVGNYDILERSLNAASGNQDNGLVPAWCNSAGTPVVAYSGAPTHFQNDSTRTPFRIGQDYCYFGDARAKAYLAKISAFYASIGVSGIVDGYNLDGTPRPERATNGAQAASFVGPAGVGAMSDGKYQSFVDAAYAAVATLNLNAGTIYYQKSWAALSLLMLTGNFVDLTRMPE